MNGQFFVFVIGSSLAVGLGFGLAVSENQLVLEGYDTPIGSFVLRYNSPQTHPPSLPYQERNQSMWNYKIA
jgi:hypothetical protein